jgi:hypothetical protein
VLKKRFLSGLPAKWQSVSMWFWARRFTIPAVKCWPKCPNKDQMSRILLSPPHF